MEHLRTFWLWFYGHSNPIRAKWNRPPRWYPDILTIAWWRWTIWFCGSFRRKSFYRDLLRELRLYYQRNMRRQAKRPICWIKGHDTYESLWWTRKDTICSRCKKTVSTIRWKNGIVIKDEK